MGRLLLVSFSCAPGPERHAVQLAHVLRALTSRFSVDALTVKSGDLPYVERMGKARMFRVPTGAAGPAERLEAFRRAVRRQLESEEYDLVHVRSAWEGLPVAQLKDRAGHRMVLEIARSPSGEPRAASGELAARLTEDERECVAAADVVLVPTEAARAHVARLGHGAKTEVVSPGVDVDLFDWERVRAPASPRPRVLYLGWIGPGRGVRLLLSACARLLPALGAELQLVGPIEPGFEGPLAESIDAHGLRGAVEATGPIAHADVPRVIAAAEICIAPAAPEPGAQPLASYPTKLLEYLACRKAVLAPRVASVAEVVRDGETGLLFEAGDAGALAAGIGRLLRDPALRERLAAAGYAWVRAHRPASATRRMLLDAYARLAPDLPWAPVEASHDPPSALPADPSTTVATRARVPDTEPWIVAAPLAAGAPARRRGGTLVGPAPPPDAAGPRDVEPLDDEAPAFSAAGALLGAADLPPAASAAADRLAPLEAAAPVEPFDGAATLPYLKVLDPRPAPGAPSAPVTSSVTPPKAPGDGSEP